MSMKAIRGAALGCMLTAVALGAQIPPVQQAQAPQDKPTFVVTIDMVTNDVIPRDTRGQFVTDLKVEDFEILEDGVPQDIAMFKLIQGGRAYNQLTPPPAPQREGIILPPPRPTVDTSGRIFVLYIDDLHLAFRNTGRLRELVKSVATNLIHEGDMFAIQSTGPSSLAVDLTYDRKRIDEALKKISGSGLTPKDIIEGPQGGEGPSEVRYRANVAFSTAYETMMTLEQVRDRRKAFIYISEGYDFNPFYNSRFGVDPYQPAIDSRRAAARTIPAARGPAVPVTRSSGGRRLRPVDQARTGVRRRGPGGATRGPDARSQPRERLDLHGRSARPGRDAGHRRQPRHGGVAEVRPEVDRQPSRAGRVDRRHRGCEPERLRPGAEAD